jgi:hypothetical protein
MDINGDGLADLVERAVPGELWCRLNLANHTFSRRKVITGLPVTIGANVVRWADVNGNGTTDLGCRFDGHTTNAGSRYRPVDQRTTPTS